MVGFKESKGEQPALYLFITVMSQHIFQRSRSV
jgi:hypothetical protein